MNQQIPKTVPVNIDANSLKDVACECGSILFTQVGRIKYVSALQSPEGKEGLVKMLGLVCMECGKPESEVLKYFEKKQKEEFDSKLVQLKG